MSLPVKHVSWAISLEPAQTERLKRRLAADLRETDLEKIQIIWVKAAQFRDDDLKTPWIGPDLFSQAKTGYVVNFLHNGKNHSHRLSLKTIE